MEQNLTPDWPSAQLMGARFVGMDEGTKTVEMAFVPPAGFANMRGNVQGGLLAGFLDEAMGAAVYLGTNGKLQLSLDINLSLLAPVAMEPITVKARPVKAGRRITFVEAELFDHKGHLCARATATAMATEWPGGIAAAGENADG
ncbi:hotdog fold thioesterase [Erythrobacter arachoides]|uniref:Hotdog fold thioesterase n=1 Tax=Aurantiacibacter arachoides TaxID=1850444 RepID=A0A845A0Q4_9SPHN|nr:PaaI family thioesterase [Aurantiacibacter arachoides]MXO92557.1 hotdog fold thioesterase [Aurantiacibacter arachoides]GGD56263.1 hypothetical protein GCM10011411_15310 [Aurantiacibacter arachoides]